MTRAFYFHYNKPASQRTGRAQVSVHFKNQCLIVDNVQCHVPCFGQIKKISPKFVMSGQAHVVEVRNGIAIIS